MNTDTKEKDKELRILKSNARKLYETGSTENKTLIDTLWPGEFKPIDITERIKTWDDVLEWHGISEEQFAARIEIDDDDEAAYKRMKLLARCLNELRPGEELDRGKTWYFPVFNRNAAFEFAYTSYDIWNSYTIVGERLSYKEARLAIYAGQTFPEIFKPFMLKLNK